MNLVPSFPTPHNSTLRGVFLLLTAMFIFTIQDSIIKLMSGDYPLLQIVLIRSLFSIPIILLILQYNGGIQQLRETKEIGGHIWRGASMFSAYAFYYLGLAALPFNLHLVIFFASPLFITALSVPLLQEQVGWRRWAAVSAGFIGVIIIIQPNNGRFEPAVLLSLASAFMYALSIIQTRKIKDSAAKMSAYTAVVYISMAALLAPVFSSIDVNHLAHPSLTFLTQAWQAMPVMDWLLLLLLSVFWGVGLTMLSKAYQLSHVSILAPFEYFAIFFGIIVGFLIWREIPTAVTLIGLIFIVGSGLYIVYRENQA